MALVVESTGLFTDADKARGHLIAGAKKVRALSEAFVCLRTLCCSVL